MSIYTDANPTALYLKKPPLRYEVACGEKQGDEYVHLLCTDNTKIQVKKNFSWHIFKVVLLYLI